MTSPGSTCLSAEPRSETVARAAGLPLSVAIHGNRVAVFPHLPPYNGRHELRPEDAREIAGDLVRAADVIDGKLANSGARP